MCSNHVPWAVIGACYVICPILLLVIRAVLARENKLRDAEPVDDEEEYVIERITEDGKRVEVKVDKVGFPNQWLQFVYKADTLPALGIPGFDG
jgi:hypothetical protein